MLYFLLAYHYGLMSLTSVPECRYPGFVMLDFPAEMIDGSSVADKENFVLEPFIRLLNQDGMEGMQLIAAGSAFEGIEEVNRIELREIWR